MIAKTLVDIMKKNGVPMSTDEYKKVLEDFDKAVKNDNIKMIEIKGKPIGFFTYINKGDRVLINYAFIYKQFRSRFNFMSLRKWFRDTFNTRFTWKSRRRNRICIVR